MQFSEKLKKLRADKGVSQSELAEKIYVSRSAVAKWENGLGLPSSESLSLLAEFFGVDKSELLSDPETANVIITKNNKLSKQKLWIIILVTLSCVLIAIAAILIPFAVSNYDPLHGTTPLKELIFETEKDIADLDAKNYTDDNISIENYYAPTRIFTYNSRNTKIRLPKLLLKTTVGGGANSIEVNVKTVSLTAGEDCQLSYDEVYNYLYITAPNSPYSQKKEYCVNLAVDDLRISIKVRQESIPVNYVDLYIGINNVQGGVGAKIGIEAHISPADATYQALRYSVEKITKPDGSLYTDKLSQYAYFGGIEDDIYLYITQEIEIGAKVYIYAEAEHDQVRSNVLQIEVTRTPIRDISLETNKPDSLKYGTTCWFRLLAEDENATFNVKGENFEVTLLTSELAEIEYSRGINMYFITATNDRKAIGKSIGVLVTTPEGFSRTFYWTIVGTPVEEVLLINADTGEELSDSTTIAKGETMHFTVKVLPENADYFNTKLFYQSYYSEDFTTSQDGDILTITVHEDAQDGIRGSVWAYVYTTYSAPYQAIRSKNYTIQVETIPIERVILKTDTDILVKGQTMAHLSYEVIPANANIKLVALHGIDYADGVHALDWQVWADYSAVGGSQVSFKVTCGGVESNIVTLTVQNMPVEEVALGITSLKIVKGVTYPLTLRYNVGADPETVEYKLLDEPEGVRISNNYLFIITGKLEINTKFRVQAVVDGIASNILNIEVVDKEPDEEIIELAKGNAYTLNQIYYPDAEGNVMFILLGNVSENEVFLLNRLHYDYAGNYADVYTNLNSLMIYSSANTDRILRVMAIVDGVADRVFTFKIV